MSEIQERPNDVAAEPNCSIAEKQQQEVKSLAPAAPPNNEAPGASADMKQLAENGEKTGTVVDGEKTEGKKIVKRLRRPIRKRKYKTEDLVCLVSRT